MSKPNEDKYEPLLIYTSFIEALSKVREYGKEKHGSYEDWTTTESIRHFNAAIRHIRAHVDGEVNDQGSGLLHLAHAASNIMFEIERIKREQVRERNLCCLCHKNWVDVDDGYDTCEECRSEM